MQKANEGGVTLSLFRDFPERGLRRLETAGEIFLTEAAGFDNALVIEITIDGKVQQFVTLKNSFVLAAWIFDSEGMER